MLTDAEWKQLCVCEHARDAHAGSTAQGYCFICDGCPYFKRHMEGASTNVN